MFISNWKNINFITKFIHIAALKFCFKSCVAMKFVDDDDDDDIMTTQLCFIKLNEKQRW